MSEVLVDGAIIELTASALWGWGTSAIATPSFGNKVEVVITGTGNKLTVDGKPVVLGADIVSAVASLTDSYHASSNFGVFANIAPLAVGLDGTVSGVTMTGITPSSKSSTLGLGVILEDASGTFSIIVTVPAIAPIPPPPAGVPLLDPVLTKPGTWAVKSSGQSTVRFTST